jgi:hypothetical protein
MCTLEFKLCEECSASLDGSVLPPVVGYQWVIDAICNQNIAHDESRVLFA